MRLFMMGCEYVGKTTLAAAITKWIKENMGGGELTGWHDHFVLPDVGQGPTREAQRKAVAELVKTVPALVEINQRHQFCYHLQSTLYRRDDFMVINWYYADVVYVPLYYPALGAEARQRLAVFIEHDLKCLAPDMVLILLKASPEVIRERMRRDPHPDCPLQEEHVEVVLEHFQKLFEGAILDSKITIDTTNLTVEQTLQEFLRKVEPYLQPVDRQRILTHLALKQMGIVA